MKKTVILAAALSALSISALAQTAQDNNATQPTQVASADQISGAQAAAGSRVSDEDRYAAHPHVSKMMVDTFWPAQGDVNWEKRPGH